MKYLDKEKKFLDMEIKDTYENASAAFFQYLKDSKGEDGMVEIPVEDLRWIFGKGKNKK